MKIYLRQGECNQCGNCCADSPFPGDWPSAIRNWPIQMLEIGFPHNRLIPLPTSGGPVKGMAEVNGEQYPYEWVVGHGVTKSAGCYECPFLKGAQGDEKRPCALYDTKYHYMWDERCSFAPTNYVNKAKVDKWFANNPDCSYTFEEVDR